MRARNCRSCCRSWPGPAQARPAARGGRPRRSVSHDGEPRLPSRGGLAAVAVAGKRPAAAGRARRRGGAPARGCGLHTAFERPLPVGELEEMLRSAGARVVEGPGTSGIFGIAPVTTTARGSAPSGEASPQMRALAARLRADARVRWVEPLTGTDGAEGAQGRRTREP